jgi:hypothetical protein
VIGWAVGGNVGGFVGCGVDNVVGESVGAQVALDRSAELYSHTLSPLQIHDPISPLEYSHADFPLQLLFPTLKLPGFKGSL